jgi:hypothetical protein
MTDRRAAEEALAEYNAEGGTPLEQVKQELATLPAELSVAHSRYEHWFKEATTLRAEVETWKESHAAACDLADRHMNEKHALRATNERLRAALKLALESDGGITYDGEDDAVGYRPCCRVSSYKPHEPDCWVTVATAALAQEKKDLVNREDGNYDYVVNL